jgi:hypothetical protein
MIAMDGVQPLVFVTPVFRTHIIEDPLVVLSRRRTS